MKYIPAEKLIAEIEKRKAPFKKDIEDGVYPTYLCALMDFEDLITSLQQEQPHKSFCEENCKGYRDTGGKCFFGFNCSAKKAQEQPDEQPEYGYLFTEYVHGKKSRWNVGDVLAYYISTSNEEGEYILGKIVNVEFNEEYGWDYTFEDESVMDEQSLVEEGAYKKN